MIKLQNSGVSLVLWALSPRLRVNFRSDFDLEFLGGIRTIPLSDKSSTTVMEALLRLANVEQDDRIRKFINRQMNFLTTQLRPYRHAECALLHHLTELKSKSPAMNFCSYIGVSKLSCFGCIKWIDSFNNCHNTRWMTSGTQEKIYPWGYFETQDEITQDMLRTMREVHTEVRDVFAERCRIRFGPGTDLYSATSDSSVDDVNANFNVKRVALDKARKIALKNLPSD